MAKKSLSTHFAVYIRAKPVKQNALNYLLYTQVRHLTVHWCLSTKTPSYAFNKKKLCHVLAFPRKRTKENITARTDIYQEIP